MMQESQVKSSKENIYGLFHKGTIDSSEFSQPMKNLQQDYIDAWKNLINLTISLEREYITKLGYNTIATDVIQDHIMQMIETSAQAYLKQNKITKCTEITTESAFETFNENTKGFVSFNEEILEYLMSAFKLKIKTR